MLKRAIALLAVVLAGSASADGWRSLRLDGSSEDSFTKSVAALQGKLSAARRLVFDAALQDIWIQGTKDADATQRAYTASEYFQKLDGLGYEEVVTLTDPTGETAENRYKVAARENRYSARSAAGALPPTDVPTGPDGWHEKPVPVGPDGPDHFIFP